MFLEMMFYDAEAVRIFIVFHKKLRYIIVQSHKQSFVDALNEFWQSTDILYRAKTDTYPFFPDIKVR